MLCFRFLSSATSWLLPQTLWQIWQELSSLSFCSIRIKWVPGHSFLLGKEVADELADELARGGVLLASCAIPCSFSPFTSLIHSCFFSDWRHDVSSKFFDTQAPSVSNEDFVFPRHARSILSCLRCTGHSFLLSFYLSRIGRIENPSGSSCGHLSQDTSHFILHCPAADSLGRLLFADSISLRPLI